MKNWKEGMHTKKVVQIEEKIRQIDKFQIDVACLQKNDSINVSGYLPTKN